MIKIDNPEFVRENGNFSVQFKIGSSQGKKILWYNLSEKYADLVSKLSDAPLVALLIPAMICGEDIQLSGRVSERLFYNISGTYQHIIQSIIPSLRPVNIYVKNLLSVRQKPLGVAMGFSAGIDSFSALADHYYNKKTPKNFRVTHLLYNNVGSHSIGTENLYDERFCRANMAAEQLFKKRYLKTKTVAEHIGLPLIAINTNMDSFYKGSNASYLLTHTPRNVSVALLLQDGIKRFYYASGNQYKEVFIGPSDTISNSDIITLPLLSTESLDISSVGGEYTRVEKILQVAKIKDSYSSLDVCVKGDRAGNCSTCFKCMRTELTLEIAGLLDKYAGVFDLSAYRANRKKYIAKVLLNRDSYMREIISFAKERGYKFPIDVQIYSLIQKPLKRALNLAHIVIKKIKKTGIKLKGYLFLKTLHQHIGEI